MTADETPRPIDPQARIGHVHLKVADLERALRHAYEEAGGTGVPMFVIGDRTLTGLQDRATLEAVIEKELARHDNSTAT